MNVKVSIIMALYKSESYMRKAIESILNQTLHEIELILVDDASPDNSLLIAQEYAQKYPEIIRVIHHESNMRAGGARNTGLRVAEGEYVWFVDADDWLAPNALEQMYLKAKEDNYDVISCDYYTVDDKNVISEKAVISINDAAAGEMNTEKKLEYVANGSAGFAKLLKRDYLLENKLFYPENIMFEDNGIVPLWGGAAKKVATIHTGLYFYSVGNVQSQTRTKKTEKVLSDRRAAERYLIDKSKELGLYDELYPALEYIYTLTSYISIVRFYIFENCELTKRFYFEMKKDAHFKFPHFMKNTYIKNLDKGNRIALKIGELGYSWLVITRIAYRILKKIKG